jgi:aldose 1-epimerase
MLVTMPASNTAVVPLSGAQFTLESHGYRAEIAGVGAALRSLTFQGRDLVRPFGEDELHLNFSGVILAPWPNRVIDATYTWDGEERQLDISEPARGHALHGLLVWQDFELVEASLSSVTLRSIIEPRVGYPHRVQVNVTYSLSADGLTTQVSADLLAGEPAPFGWGSHSYLVAPSVPGEASPVDGWSLSLPTDTVQTVTEDRLIPTGLAPVGELGYDFREARAIGDTFIDHAFTDLIRSDDGSARVRLTDAAGTGVEMVWDATCPWVQIHTADLPGDALSRTGLAVEPMTCPPGAFNSGTDVIRLDSDEHAEASWTIAAVGD